MKRLVTVLYAILMIGILPASALERGPDVDASIQDAMSRLAAVRERINDEKVPLARELMQLENEVLEMRREADRQQRLRDTGGMDLNALEADLKARQEEIDYISSLVTEYLTQLETRADPAELLTFRDELDRALAAIDNPGLELSEQFLRQIAGIRLGYERAERLLGGSIVAGRAVMPDGDIAQGTFLLFGPATYFSGDGDAGLALRGGTDLPVVLNVPGGTAQIIDTISSGSGDLPLDATLGKAIALASTRESLTEHILKGGVWIFPILFAAGISLAIALFKFLEIGRIPLVTTATVREIVAKIRAGEKKEAVAQANAIGGPGSELLLAAIEHSDESKELLEEILLEKIVETQPKMERLLPVIAVTAATAPLLGLLGTVTGMINTFKLITIFGTGDAKSLSSGISEALITTEFGLIVAIPSLILHAILHRKAKAVMARLEANAMAFINGISAGKGKSKAA